MHHPPANTCACWRACARTDALTLGLVGLQLRPSTLDLWSSSNSSLPSLCDSTFHTRTSDDAADAEASCLPSQLHPSAWIALLCPCRKGVCARQNSQRHRHRHGRPPAYLAYATAGNTYPEFCARVLAGLRQLSRPFGPALPHVQSCRLPVSTTRVAVGKDFFCPPLRDGRRYREGERDKENDEGYIQPRAGLFQAR